jgi:hypothetical protein
MKFEKGGGINIVFGQLYTPLQCCVVEPRLPVFVYPHPIFRRVLDPDPILNIDSFTLAIIAKVFSWFFKAYKYF